MIRDSFSSISTDVESIFDQNDLLYLNAENLLPNDLIFNTGDIIVTCRPYIHIISDSMCGKLCDLCLRSIPSKYLYECSTCKQIRFCRSCNEIKTPSIFKAIHNLECPILVKYGKILTSASRFFLRLYLRLKNPESIQYKKYTNPLTNEEIDFECLIPRIILNDGNEAEALCEQIRLCYEKYGQDLSQKIESNDEVTVVEMAVLQFINLLEELRQCDDLFELICDDLHVHDLWRIFVRLWSYAVPIFDETITGLFNKDPISYGLYLEPNVIIESHSCVPNCAFANYGPVIQLRAIKPIEKGADLTINYVDVTMPKMERIIELRNYYIEDCFCPRCSGDQQSSVDLETFNRIKIQFIQMFEKDFVSVSTKNQSFLDFSFSNTNDLDEEEWEKCYQKCTKICDLAKKLNDFHEQIFPFSHPDKTRFLFAYTAVEMNLLLFKLEYREISKNNHDQINDFDQNNRIIKTSTPIMQKNNRESGSMTTLDHLIIDIQNFSNLLKRTVKNIRFTHGVDHRLYREIPIPLILVWHLSYGVAKKLTMEELYRDPSLLLSILGCAKHKSSIAGAIDEFSQPKLLDLLKKQFSCLIPAPTPTKKLLTKQPNYGLQHQPDALIIDNERQSWDIVKKIFSFLKKSSIFRQIFMIMILFFVILLPLFVYFCLYHQTADF